MTVVILAISVREAETVAYERGLPPRSRDVMCISTDRPQGLKRLQGLLLKRSDVITTSSGERGRYIDDYKRQLETQFYDER